MAFRLFFFFLCILISHNLFSEEKKKLYKWVDEQGNVHYTDEPRKGAKELSLPELPVVKMTVPKVKAIDVEELESQRREKEIRLLGEYQNLVIESPTDDGVLRNNASMIEVTAKLNPELKAGHKVRFLLDGSEIPNSNNALTVTKNKVEYGPHNIKVEILSEKGVVIKSSETTKFTLLHTINPAKRKKNN